MTELNSKKPLGESYGIGQDNPNNEMNANEQSTKTPWFLRLPTAILWKSGLLAVLAAAIALTQAPLEQAQAASTNSLPTFSSLQEGDTIVTMKRKGKIDTIRDWLRSIFGGAAGNQLTKKDLILEAQQAYASQAWKITAYGGIVRSAVSGETVNWYFTVGKPIARSPINADNYSAPTKEEDYQYMDYETGWLYWDEENEIWKSNGEFHRSYGYEAFIPDIINDYYNQGDHGAYYPGHKYYYRGDEGNDGYFITWGVAEKIDLKHEMKSFVFFPGGKDGLLKVRASQHGKDKFKPICYAWLSDMRYEKKNDVIGWTYTERTEPEEHSHELSAIVQTVVDLGDEFVPLNTRLESQTWEKNVSTISWKTVSATVLSGATGKRDDGREFDLSGALVETRIPDQVITTWP